MITTLKRIKHRFENRRGFKAASQYKCFVPNVNLSFAAKQPRVLLSYNPCTFQLGFKGEELTHSNGAEITEIIHLLVKKGCCVDVIDCLCREPLPFLRDRKYDYVIGFGEPYRVAHILNPKAKTVYLMTENLPSYASGKFRERCDYYYQRHGRKKTGIQRGSGLFKDEYLAFSWASIRLAEKALGTPNCKEYTISPSGIVNPDYQWNAKNYVKARNHFVWFGSAGAIHKGLDILVDVFKELPNYHLHIYGLNKKEYFLLKGITPNIHNEGTVRVTSDRYIQNVVNRCAFAILPSCSEMMSTGMITGMLHGLIPIVSEECQFPLFSFGAQLKDYKCDYITEIVTEWACKAPSELEKKSKDAYDYARSHYMLSHYSSNMSVILDELINSSND